MKVYTLIILVIGLLSFVDLYGQQLDRTSYSNQDNDLVDQIRLIENTGLKRNGGVNYLLNNWDIDTIKNTLLQMHEEFGEGNIAYLFMLGQINDFSLWYLFDEYLRSDELSKLRVAERTIRKHGYEQLIPGIKNLILKCENESIVEVLVNTLNYISTPDALDALREVRVSEGFPLSLFDFTDNFINRLENYNKNPRRYIRNIIRKSEIADDIRWCFRKIYQNPFELVNIRFVEDAYQSMLNREIIIDAIIDYEDYLDRGRSREGLNFENSEYFKVVYFLNLRKIMGIQLTDRETAAWEVMNNWLGDY
ncbi:MAG: hypothetical protein AAGF87_02525 [Bacteroidota bacterium]